MLRLATRAPFHLEATVRVLQRRPTNLVERWEQNRYIRVITTRAGLSVVEVENRGTIDAPNVHFSISHGSASKASRTEIERILRVKLGLDVDPRPLQRRAEAVPALRTTARALRGMRPPRFADLFEAFANVIPFQQVSLDAGIAIVTRLVERFGLVLEHAGTRRYAFPTASTIASARLEALRRCGLSGHKAIALKNCARLIASGKLTDEAIAAASTEQALAILAALPGIGPWSAALVLLRGFGRLDVFPPGDVGVARNVGRIASSLAPIVERFGPIRGYLYFCLLGGALLERGLIKAAR
ncbi:MAG TPA: AlkA N-terminal domain-containing protein [Kofleriaceae bacterium]|nr:AlkA N-terminal domain-containing protein [Kofleriaceae bacterium]